MKKRPRKRSAGRYDDEVMRLIESAAKRTLTPEEEVNLLYRKIGESCHVCKKHVARRMDGAFFKHQGKETHTTCPGSGASPEVTLAKPLRAFLYETGKMLHVFETTSIERGGAADDVRKWLRDMERTGIELLRALLIEGKRD